MASRSKLCVSEYMHLYFRARFHLLLLRNGVGHHHGFEGGTVDAGNGRTGENAVREDGIDLYRTGIDQPEGENYTNRQCRIHTQLNLNWAKR